jgi:hypothetical protein
MLRERGEDEAEDEDCRASDMEGDGAATAQRTERMVPAPRAVPLGREPRARARDADYDAKQALDDARAHVRREAEQARGAEQHARAGPAREGPHGGHAEQEGGQRRERGELGARERELPDGEVEERRGQRGDECPGDVGCAVVRKVRVVAWETRLGSRSCAPMYTSERNEANARASPRSPRADQTLPACRLSTTSVTAATAGSARSSLACFCGTDLIRKRRDRTSGNEHAVYARRWIRLYISLEPEVGAPAGSAIVSCARPSVGLGCARRRAHAPGVRCP